MKNRSEAAETYSKDSLVALHGFSWSIRYNLLGPCNERVDYRLVGITGEGQIHVVGLAVVVLEQLLLVLVRQGTE